MKFSKPSQLFMVSFIGLLVAALLTACSIETIDYVFVATASGIETYAADSQSGALRTGAATITDGVNSPVAMVVSSNYANLYVANKGNDTIVHYTISMSGVLTKEKSVTASSTPVAIAVNAAGTYLYVVSGTKSATLTVYPLTSGEIGAAVSSQTLTVPDYTGDTIVPTGVTVLGDDSAVFVTAYDQSAYNPGAASGTVFSTANPGWVFSFVVGTSGSLTAATNSPYEAGTKPSALAADPRYHYLYVTDYASNQLIGYTILDGSILNFMTSGPFKTGNEPSAITIDPRGKFIYVANMLDSTISAYAITLATGNPTAVSNTTGSQLNSTDSQPVAILVDPALGRFVYTANHLGNSVSGFRLNSTSGAMTSNQGTPYSVGSDPTALVMVPHGNHASQSVTP
jgi:6-phosphogluconolactonase (cycloisomerase 2 family)